MGADRFQFTPLREGRHRRCDERLEAHPISIHAPPRGATSQCNRNNPQPHFNSRPSARGDEAKQRKKESYNEFQFTPLREGRRYFDTVPHKATKFQFTPLREGRRTEINHIGLTCDFNSRPSARGDGDGGHFRNWQISIHAPPRGATPRYAGRIYPRKFQFTPLREGRLALATCLAGSGHISIHAPPRGATGCARL